MSTERQRPIERLASALQNCFDEAVEQGARRAEERIEAKFGPRFDKLNSRLDRQDATIRAMKSDMDTRLDRQDDTLRAMWKQMKGNGSLPIDD